jgi:hypothetical protein
MRRRAISVLAAYYVASGVWPLVHMRSFEAVTGPKTEHWLVKTVAVLAVANGVALAAGLQRDEIATETIVLAVCSAAAFTSIDVVYATRGRIAPIYLADAALEVALAAAIVAG